MRNKDIIPSVVVFVLAVGTSFAFSAVAADFVRFFAWNDSLWNITSAGPFPHPATTPCFWGAFAFAGALVWSLVQLKKKSARSQQHLVWFLLAGNAFAWTNVTIQFWQFCTAAPGEQVSCSGVPITNPFATPCFIGASLFFLSLIAAYVALRTLRRG